MVIHEKTFGKPDLNRDSVTEEQCRQYATSLGKQYLTDYYSNLPKGCVLNSDEKIYFNQQYTSVSCTTTIICYESVTRRKRNIGAKFYLDDWGRADANGITKEECQEYATSIGKTFGTTTGSTLPSGCVYGFTTPVYWKDSGTENLNCGSGNYVCVKKRDVVFDPFTPANIDVDLNRCAKVRRATYGCDYYSVDNNVCYMHSGCSETAGGVDSIYQLMSPKVVVAPLCILRRANQHYA